MNVSLTPQLESLIRSKVASGLYGNASEVVREALRCLFERDSAASHRAGVRAPELPAILPTLSSLEEALRAKGITTLSVFGSLARGEARPGSDIDILIVTDPAARFSLVDLVEIKALLEDRLGHPVDLVTREGLDPLVRERVLTEAVGVFS